jgi:fatty acid desaturase
MNLLDEKPDISSLHDIPKSGKDNIFYGVAQLYLFFVLCFAVLYFLKEVKFELVVAPFYLTLFIAIGWGQFSLSNAFHDAIHYNFGQNHKDLLAGFITAYPLGLSMSYRNAHLHHHKYFADPDKDPDYNEFAYFPSSKLAMLKRFAFMCSGFPAVRQLLHQSSNITKSKGNDRNRGKELACMIFTQVCIFLLTSISLGPFYYIFFWALPIATMGKLFSSTRLLCEHSNPTGEPVYRAITGSALETSTLGMFNFNYHADHHHDMKVPCGDLPALHQSFQEKGIQIPNAEIFHGGYFKLIWFWFKALPLT